MTVEVTPNKARLAIYLDVAVDPAKEQALDVAADVMGPAWPLTEGYYAGVPVEFVDAQWSVTKTKAES